MFVVSVRERGKEEHRFTFRKDQITIGRLRANDVILPKRNISKRHALLSADEKGEVILTDHGSTNGSFINGSRVQGTTVVGPDDKLFMGDYILQVRIEEDRSAIEHVDESTPPPVPEMEELGEDMNLTDLAMEMPSPEELMTGARSGGASPRTLAFDPASVPRFPPSAEVTETRDATLRMKEELPELEEVEEELIDIPLEIETEEEPPISRTSEPSVEIVNPTDVPQVEPIRPRESPAFVPETPLDAVYGTVASRYHAWKQKAVNAERGHALRKLAEILDELIADALPDVERRRLAIPLYEELSVPGLPETLLEDERVAEVVVSSNGQVTAFGPRGRVVDAPRKLSCEAAVHYLASGYPASKPEFSGVQEVHLPGDILVKVVPAGVFGKAPAMRFLKPHRSVTSLDGLVSEAAMTEEQANTLRQAIDKGRSILVLASRGNLAFSVVHALSLETPAKRRGIILGGCPGLAASSNLATGDCGTNVDELLEAVSVMGYDTLFAGCRCGYRLGDVLVTAGILQIPVVAPVRARGAAQLVAALQCITGQDQPWIVAFLDALSPLLVVLDAEGIRVQDCVELISTEAAAFETVPTSDG